MSDNANINQTPKQTLVLMDFDGTLTRQDSLWDFIRFVVGTGRFVLGMVWVVPIVFLMVIKLLTNQEAKHKVLRHYFSRYSQAELDTYGMQYAQRITHLLRPYALATVHHHQQHGHRVVLVSASLDIWLASWAKIHHLELLCTRASYNRDGYFDGIAGNNCHGAEKARRIHANINVARYDTIVAYGDSSGDTQMLALADEIHYQPKFDHAPR